MSFWLQGHGDAGPHTWVSRFQVRNFKACTTTQLAQVMLLLHPKPLETAPPEPTTVCLQVYTPYIHHTIHAYICMVYVWWRMSKISQAKLNQGITTTRLGARVPMPCHSLEEASTIGTSKVTVTLDNPFLSPPFSHLLLCQDLGTSPS